MISFISVLSGILSVIVGFFNKLNTPYVALSSKNPLSIFLFLLSFTGGDLAV